LLNLGAAMLILASLTTRFIYPLIILEGRRFWILGLSY
jgi:ABC-2 type transport system permease protein